MTWAERLREAAYTSPAGERLTFAYTAVQSATPKRSTAFEFPGVDGAYVQDNGRGPRQFALRCYFSGGDHDLEATVFELALLERGVGRLEHPTYGTHDVVPMGTITRRDDLRSSANQTIIEVKFSVTLAEVYPRTQVDLRGVVELALLALAEDSIADLGEALDLGTVAARESVKADLRVDAKRTRAALAALANATAKARRAFRDAERKIEGGIDSLIGAPIQLAQDLHALVQAPARSTASISAKLEAYGQLLEGVITAPRAAPWDSFVDGVVLPGRARLIANEFRTSAFTAAAVVAGAVTSTLEHDFRARPEALAAATDLLALFDSFVTWADRGFAALDDADTGDLDTGGTYQGLQEVAATAAGYLTEISFSLLPERRIVLDRPRTIIDLAAELYGSVDDRLDYLIDTNALSGSEILELPRGRSIVYYS